VIQANLRLLSISLCSSQLRTSVRTVDIYMSAARAAHKLELRLADVTFRASLSGRESNHLSIYTPIVVGWVGSKLEGWRV